MELVFLFGAAAAGKLTVARELAARIHFGVFHNHLIVDALTAVFTFGSPPFVRLREEFWLATFAEAAASGTDLVFTFAPEPTVEAGFPGRARQAVEEAGGHVRFVRLDVGDDEQERRIEDPSRSEFAKLNDLPTLRRMREREAGSPATETIPADLSIDTERFAPAEAAQLIIDAFALRPATPHARYPGD
ncbi:hypothetical protein ASF88_02015 [Leifsonia sp. Leaf336]|uniref:hypothetical protein n=1 Tax=Leifsonia sp. Leaf336 TaxID=1736341 RepID=UPI0006FFC22E|nr:hypothetical protein [Leifsonia sp. Leaf336]KQR53659.1 hypothetical protein ASF88_02015 [Leifsonia sp. Leaf336]